MNLPILMSGAVLLAAVNLPCGALKVPDTRALSAAANAQQRGQAKAKRECEPIRKRQVPFQEETSLGGAVAVRFVSGGGNLLIEPGKPKSDVTQLNRYLNRVGKNLAAQSDRPTIPWTFGIMKSKDFNAVSAPGGYVFVAAGLLEQVQTEAQLAGVLAHEIAHVTGRHAIHAYNEMVADKCTKAAFAERDRALTKAVLSSLDAPAVMNQITAKLNVPGGFIDFDSAEGAKLLGPVVDGLSDVLMKGYSHEDEYEADQVAIDLLVSAGYNPHEYIHFLSRIPDQRGLMTSHPDKDDRQKKARAYLMALATKGPFGGADYSKYAAVKLKDELKVVRK